LESQGPGLKQGVGLFQAVMYGTGLILGAGIYVLIGDVAGVAGNAMWISFIVAAIIATFTGLSYAELTSMLPKSAAEYMFVKNAFGNSMFAFVTGWLIIFVAVASAAAVAIGFSAYLVAFIPGLDPLVSSIALIIALTAINFVGIRESAWMSTVFTLVELAGLAAIIGAGMLMASPAGVDYFEMPPAVTSDTLAAGAILGAAGLAFFAYFGFENLANIAEETRNPRKAIPVALMASIVITTVVYVLVAVSAIALVGWDELASTDAPITLAAEKAFGRTGAVLMSFIALFATTNTVLALLVAGSRIVFGMASDGALPALFSKVHQKRQTPFVAILSVMAGAVGIVAVSSGRIDAVASVAVFGIFIVYAFVNLSLIRLRYSRPEMDRPFRSPWRVGRFPVFAGLGAVTSVAMLTQFDWITAVAGIAAIGSGFAVYLLVRRK
jgi:basic amino acid/polyamine antiporter, APA family